MALESIWVLAEQRRGVPAPAALELLAAARPRAERVEVVSYGTQAGSIAGVVGAHGAARLHDLGDLGESLPGPRVAAAIASEVEAGRGPDAVFIGTSYDGRDVAARLSARLDRPVLTNVVGLADGGEGTGPGQLVTEHAVFGGTEIVRARLSGPGPALVVIRPKSFTAEETGGAPAEVVALAAPGTGPTDAARVVARHAEEGSGPSLDDATVVVAGGRGLGSAESYTLVERLARLLGGAPAASRAIVDAGWVPYSHQVGQTGKTVKPTVYLACGISGATQHLVGMKGASHVIAINKDREAPIFSIADLGVVGDVTVILPKLIAALEARRGEPAG